MAEVSRNVLAIRYSLLPYYYTLFFKAATSVEGAATVTRPLFFEFPKDVMTYGIDTQFMVGRCLLVSPVLKLGEVCSLIGVCSAPRLQVRPRWMSTSQTPDGMTGTHTRTLPVDRVKP